LNVIELDWGGGRKVRLRETSRYDAALDAPSVRLSVWWDGHEYFCRAPVEPGKSLREAREKGMKALEIAVRAGKFGEVSI